MTKTYVISMIVCMFFNATAIGAKPYPIEWMRQFGTNYSDGANDVAIDEFGNVFITGYTTYGSLGSNLVPYAFLRKYDSAGAELWTRQLGTSVDASTSTSVAINENGDAYISGYTRGSFGGQNAGGVDVFLTKIDPLGRVLWKTQTGTRSDDESNAIAVDRFDNVYITGSTKGAMNGTNAGGRDQFLAKFKSSGALLWTKQLGTNGFDQGNSIATDSSGNIYISGSTGSRATLTKFDDQSSTLWTKQLGMNSVRSDGVAVDKFDNVYATGPTRVSGSDDSYLIKLNGLGEELWTKIYGTAGALDISTSLALDRFGNSFITGWTNDSLIPYSIHNDVFLAMFNSSGTEIWRQEFGSTDADWGLSVTADMRGNVYIAGRTEGDLGGINCHCVRVDDAFLVKFTVPEPSSRLLCLLGVYCILGRTRKRGGGKGFVPGSSRRFNYRPAAGQCTDIFSRKNATLSRSWSIPSTPSSMLIQPSKPTPASTRKMAS